VQKRKLILITCIMTNSITLGVLINVQRRLNTKSTMKKIIDNYRICPVILYYVKKHLNPRTAQAQNARQWVPRHLKVPKIDLKNPNFVFIAFLHYNFQKPVGARAPTAPMLTRSLSLPQFKGTLYLDF